MTRWPLHRAAGALAGLALCAGAAVAQPAAAAATAAASASASASASAEAEADWPLAGRQGLIRVVIVPLAQATDAAAYHRQIARLCADASQSCFVNFYTNSSGAEVSLPLPDAIAHEATVVFRRSIKQGAELFSWSCRLQIDPQRCF